MTPPPDLPGVQHRYVSTADGVRIHVAEAGPPDGPALMLVHGFPQHWWEWRHQIGPLAGDGYRVLVPDLRGAGWSDAPRTSYTKAEMAEDLLAVLDALGVERAWIGAHDWGGLTGSILLLRHPERVSGLAGFNSAAPWLSVDGPNLRRLWAFGYQYPLACPGLGPRLIGGGDQRYVRWMIGVAGGGYRPPETDIRLYLERLRDPDRAEAGSRWYRSFQTREVASWARGEYAGARVSVPLRWVTGLRDPVITPALHRGYERYASDITFEHVPHVGHWIVEQAAGLVLDRLRQFLSGRA